LDAVVDYIAADNPRAAIKVFRQVRSAVARLQAFPSLGHPGQVPGTRELIVAGTPFIVPYRVDDDQIIVIAIRHAARQWPQPE
jgi:toxin ParE1/3/4